jgi:hypothetical protein
VRGAPLLASLLVTAFLQAVAAPALSRVVAADDSTSHCRCVTPMDCCKRGFCPMERRGAVIGSCGASSTEALPPLVEIHAVPVGRVAVVRVPDAVRIEFATVLRREAVSSPPATPPPRES